MIDRICISINNKCNLKCTYCHFHEKDFVKNEDMDVIKILTNVKEYAKRTFKIGFVGNGEPFLDFKLLRKYLEYIEDNEFIKTYTITNGTIPITPKDIEFLEEHRVNVGFSLDGYKDLHNVNRCNTFDVVMENIEKYKTFTGHYPTFNATVGKKTLENLHRVIDFFKPFGAKITFSRMIGFKGITLEEYRMFINEAEKHLQIRKGLLDCTMYGGKCGAGKNNYFFANKKVYYCGNCIDLSPVDDSSVSLFELEKISLNFNRDYCYKESL